MCEFEKLKFVQFKLKVPWCMGCETFEVTIKSLWV